MPYSSFKNTAFQSTPSAWRETLRELHRQWNAKFQSTPSAWRETPLAQRAQHHPAISIHSLRMEGDALLQCFDTVPDHFNPLPPHGGRLEKNGFIYGVSYISIHSLRMEGDIGRCTAGITFGYFNPLPPHGGRLIAQSPALEKRYFNPLPPHGGRQFWLESRGGNDVFQSTPSAWRETSVGSAAVWRRYISIHSLRMEGDCE